MARHARSLPTPTRTRQRLALLTVNLLSAAWLAACGGGGDTAVVDTATVNGNAADASTMPLAAAEALDEATVTLESALATTASDSGGSSANGSNGSSSTAAADGLVQPQAAAQAGGSGVGVTVACAGGGSVRWSISGGTLQQQLNGQLDAGETYDVTFTACAGANTGLVLDGRLSLVVNARSSTASTSAWDLALSATGLALSGAPGSFTVNGSARSQRSSSTLADGGTQLDSHFSADTLALASGLSGRQASYQLKTLDWTVARRSDAAGALLSRSHQGTLALVVGSTRRPAATLQVASLGSATVGSDGLAASGSFRLTTGGDRVDVVYGSATVTVSVDLGNDGSIDKTWTLSRGSFQGEAG